MSGVKLSTDFGAAGREYRLYRPSYPMGLFSAIFNHLSAPYKNAADLGAGTGISTKVLADKFESVTAVEPDAKMMDKSRMPDNVSIIIDCAENAKIRPESCQLITSGNAFYWMDGVRLLPMIESWLEPNGIFAAYRYGFPSVADKAVNDILQAELTTHWDEYRDDRLRDTGYTCRTIYESGLFPYIGIYRVDNVVELSIEALVGFFTSTSFASKYIQTLSDRETYISNVVSEIEKVTDKTFLTTDFGLELIIAKK